VGLVSVAAGATQVQLRWEARDADGADLPIGIFSGPDRASVHQGAPIATAVGDGVLVVTIPSGATRYFGLALDVGGGTYEQAGHVLVARSGAPYYVDPASTAVNPDGSSPAQAFRDPLDAVVVAFALGGGNVWIAAGDYTNVGLPLRPGVHVFGGFDASFDLASRDPQAHPTRFVGRVGDPVCEILGGSAPVVIDGCTIDGASAAPFGIDIDATDAELRSVEVRDCAGRGVRLRSIDETRAVDVRIARSRVINNQAQGVSLTGPFDLWIEGSRFAGNRLEGVDLGGLVAPGGVPVSLRVRDSSFVGNGHDGLDCDLSPPSILGAGGGRYEIRIESSNFERNGYSATTEVTAGLKIDIDFELIPDWSAEILVRGSRAAQNRGDGVLLDLDSTCSAFVHRLLSTANGGDGLSVTSESTASFAVVSASVFTGNVGAGLKAELGQVPIVASHCVLAGNLGGGMTSSTVTSAVSSTVAWLQPNAYSGVREYFNVLANDPFVSPFEHAPVEYLRANSIAGGDVVLANSATLVVGDHVELADDGVQRSVAGFSAGNHVALSPAPTLAGLPSTLARFAGPGVVEDYRLAPGSSANASGMPDPFAGPMDAGPFGAPLGGEPAREGAQLPALFYAGSSVPSVSQSLSSAQAIRIAFVGGAPAGSSVNPQSVRVLNAQSTVLATTAFVQNGELVVQPPAGGWPSGALLLELHAALRSTAGTPIATPLAAPFTAQ